MKPIYALGHQGLDSRSDDHETLFTNAQEELLWRLNEWWHGRHPGQPINWKGLNGQ